MHAGQTIELERTFRVCSYHCFSNSKCTCGCDSESCRHPSTLREKRAHCTFQLSSRRAYPHLTLLRISRFPRSLSRSKQCFLSQCFAWKTTCFTPDSEETATEFSVGCHCSDSAVKYGKTPGLKQTQLLRNRPFKPKPVPRKCGTKGSVDEFAA